MSTSKKEWIAGRRFLTNDPCLRQWKSIFSPYKTTFFFSPASWFGGSGQWPGETRFSHCWWPEAKTGRTSVLTAMTLRHWCWKSKEWPGTLGNEFHEGKIFFDNQRNTFVIKSRNFCDHQRNILVIKSHSITHPLLTGESSGQQCNTFVIALAPTLSFWPMYLMTTNIWLTSSNRTYIRDSHARYFTSTVTPRNTKRQGTNKSFLLLADFCYYQYEK